MSVGREEALGHIRQAIEIGRRSIPHHPRMVEALRELARFYCSRQQFALAIPLYEEAIKVARRHPEDLPGVADGLAAELKVIPAGGQPPK